MESAQHFVFETTRAILTGSANFTEIDYFLGPGIGVPDPRSGLLRFLERPSNALVLRDDSRHCLDCSSLRAAKISRVSLADIVSSIVVGLFRVALDQYILRREPSLRRS